MSKSAELRKSENSGGSGEGGPDYRRKILQLSRGQMLPPHFRIDGRKYAESGAEGQNRTVDTSLFRAVLCQLSYLGTEGSRSFSAGWFPYLRDQPTPRASYQGRISDFHIFCTCASFLLAVLLAVGFQSLTSNAPSTQDTWFTAWSDESTVWA
jgi:hypothetical protein